MLKNNSSTKTLRKNKSDSKILSLRPISASSLHPHNQNKKDSSYPILFSSNSNADFSSSIITRTLPQKMNKTQLYEETLQLKREVNKLKNQISLERSDKRKKEVEIMQKEKVLEDVMGDIKSSNSVNPVSFDKLKDTNSINKIKKDYKELKQIFLNEKRINESLKNQIQAARPNNSKFMCEQMCNKLIKIANEYSLLEQLNQVNANELNKLENLRKVFQDNHQMIEYLQIETEKKSKSIKLLKEENTNYSLQHQKNKQYINKQIIEIDRLTKQNEKMLKDKKVKENIVKKKTTYEIEIEHLKEQLKKNKENAKTNDEMINKLEKEYEENEKKANEDKSTLKLYNYKQLKKIQKNPKENENTKTLLLQSLINESFSNRRKYSKLIESYIEELKSLGCDISTLDNENGNISERNIVEPVTNEKTKTNITKQKTTVNNNESDSNKKSTDPNNNNNVNNTFMSNEELAEFSYVLIKCFEAKKITSDIAKEKISSCLSYIQGTTPKNSFILELQTKICSVLQCEQKESIDKISKWINSLLLSQSDNYDKVVEVFMSIFANVKVYSSEEELLLSKKVKKTLLPYEKKIRDKLSSESHNGFISFLVLRKAMEDEKIIMKDDYVQFLFYKMKQFDDTGISLYDLKIQNLLDIMDNTANDSKMNTESDIEISNEEYFQIITSFVVKLYSVLKEKKITIRSLLQKQTQIVQAEDSNEKFEVLSIESFVNEMKNVGIEMKSELEVYCLFSRYKISDEYEVISVDLLEKEIEAYEQSKINENANKKVMENVEEENESNISAETGNK